ncbi:MAG: HU family DNA-binding protein [Spiroplasmataceae bacterium]|jgi:nucleoid DNA-binding protein|nr:HU family DNA-binding protein [Spiroplasmataceae bacterium]
MTKKSLPKKVVKKITPNYSLKEKKEARDIAIADLINSLKKLKKDETLRFGDLGTFEKTQHQIKSSFNNQSKGKTYLYYRINFRASSHLKRELDK